MRIWMKLMVVSLVATPVAAQVQAPAAGTAPAQSTAQATPSAKPAADACEVMRKKLDDWPQLGEVRGRRRWSLPSIEAVNLPIEPL